MHTVNVQMYHVTVTNAEIIQKSSSHIASGRTVMHMSKDRATSNEISLHFLLHRCFEGNNFQKLDL